MQTYKLGNQVKGIIRSYLGNKIGDVDMEYANQPYARFEGANATLTFSPVSTKATDHGQASLVYHDDELSQVTITGIPLTDKIFNLIFKSNEIVLCHTSEEFMSDENKQIFLHLPKDEVYQVFIFNEAGELETAYGSLSEGILNVQEANAPYLIFYSYEGSKSYLLSSGENMYFSLDLEFVGNTDDNAQPMFVHVEKCGISSNKGMTFRQNTHSVDLVFSVVSTKKDYITIQ